MLDRIIKFSIHHKLVIGVLTGLWVIWGTWSLYQLPVDAVPDITNNQVQIITNSPTLATQEVEQFVTYPIEQSLANLPDIEEIRSISRFGLSVVTVVFDDKVDIYFARQLINERLVEATSQIPEGMGIPELAPVSTGLGEIYQYILRPKRGSEQKYTAMDLRTMQDWIVARQLYGIPGIAEVNSFGGLSKQYEVAVDPNRLKAMNVSIPEIFTALEQNNENTGGAYIDKKPNAYFIRAIGLATSLDDIGSIVIKRSSIGIPILIRDVAEVRLGNAVRYGAVTKDGEQEVVGGIVMMLKGSNSAEVVERVKAKMGSIQKSLPADVEIDAYLDRTTLVDRAVTTVKTNLIEGALIVIFVLVLFLGNLSAGLIVASAIPLSLLFALGMMHVFGVSANLMSLGAIDFGLIVDGAVIIVEATMHHLGLRQLDRRFTQEEMNEEVYQSALKIRKSAAFGEIIILIVYIPILSLVGIEGKMFRPMAETVGFAIIGALILSLTYIPMMCALFLPKVIRHKKNISDKLMDFFHSIYDPMIKLAIEWKYIVVSSAAALIIVTIVIFSGIGGEFIPQLQEGDYAFHCILPQGSSLSQSIETSMQASKIIKSFPEVKEVVGKTGSAEVPTDPMPPEASDIMIVLKDKDEWTTTKDYNKLAEMMLEKLQVIPGIFFEASQPIQMRFNELMTGVRQDVAVKVFGENIDTLAAIAPMIAQVIGSVDGVTEPQIERTAGLPQITIQYDRSRMANYGLTIKGVNDVVSTAFAGKSTGVIYENERKFDLVVRLDTIHRTSIEDVANLFIPTGDGNQIPLSQVAIVSFKEGPAQISRENAKRRVVIGFNVRGRDVKTVVEEIQNKLGSLVRMPTGYYLTYGGSFENLEKASARLSIAVPLSLLLIFVLLYLTFRSAKQAALVFTAIPMSAIGGVFALLIRGMPFSISAGVGFIALFGVAVLNGIVLISTFNQLKKENVGDENEKLLETLVLAGTKIRLRPVLMTATVASLGFFPMAISTGAGAEVQKPLATVVIGGLVTATVLTLIVLPLLYIIFTKGKSKLKRNSISVVVILILSCIPMYVDAQITAVKRISLGEAITIATTNNLQLTGDSIQVLRSRALVGATSGIPKTGVFVENEDYSPGDPNGVLKIGLSQNLEWPGIYGARSHVAKEQLRLAEYTAERTVADVKREVRQTYYALWYLENKLRLWERLDSIYSTLATIANLKVRTGESAGLDSLSANAKAREVTIQVGEVKREISIEQQNLRKLLNTQTVFLPEDAHLEKYPVPEVGNVDTNHPILQMQKQAINISEAELDVQKQSLLPDFQLRLFSQRFYGVPEPYSGFSLTVGVPLFFGSYLDMVEVATQEMQYQETMLSLRQQAMHVSYMQLYEQLQKDLALVDYYQTSGIREAGEIIRSANLAYKAGEISFAELSQFLRQAIEIERNYLDVLNGYNQSAIQLSFLLNN